MLIEELNNSQLTAIMELVKPARILGFTKPDMVNTLKRFAEPDKVIQAMELVHNGLSSSTASPASGEPGISSVVLRNLLNDMKDSIVKELADPIPTVKGEILPEEFPEIIKRASQRINVALVGPAGCGKTHVAALVAKALDMNFGSLSISFGMPRSDLLGQFVPLGKGGAFKYAPSNFVNIYEGGGLFLLDEGDNGDPNTLGVLNQALSNDGFYIPGRIGNHYVKRHPDFVCIMAMNTYGQGADMKYVGRAQLDAATLDRFKVGTVTMDYSAKVEEALVNAKVLRWGRKIRRNIEKYNLQHVMSTRVMLDFTKLTKAFGDGEKEWGATYFQGISESDKRRMQS